MTFIQIRLINITTEEADKHNTHTHTRAASTAQAAAHYKHLFKCKSHVQTQCEKRQTASDRRVKNKAFRPEINSQRQRGTQLNASCKPNCTCNGLADCSAVMRTLMTDKRGGGLVLAFTTFHLGQDGQSTRVCLCRPTFTCIRCSA